MSNYINPITGLKELNFTNTKLTKPWEVDKTKQDLTNLVFDPSKYKFNAQAAQFGADGIPSALSGAGKSLSPSVTSGGFAGALKGGVDAMGGIGAVSGMIGNLVPDYTQNDFTKKINTGTDAAMGLVGMIPGVGQAVSAAYNIGKAGRNALNNLTKGATAVDAEDPNDVTKMDAFLDSNINAINPYSIVNAVTAKKVAGSEKELSKNLEVYDSSPDIGWTEIGGVTRAASTVGNFMKNTFGNLKEDGIKGVLNLRKNWKKAKDENVLAKREEKVNKTNLDNYLKASTEQSGKTDKMLGANNFRDIISKNTQSLYGNPFLAKNGMKLYQLKNIKNNVNVIPSGALHARKHNLEINGITKKGIPVIMEDGGELSQQAEIEKNEVILHKELTDSLEKLLKDFDTTSDQKEKDLIAIKAGKLLTKELMENTEDNTGIMETI